MTLAVNDVPEEMAAQVLPEPDRPRQLAETVKSAG
jgi:hypothetical protein